MAISTASPHIKPVLAFTITVPSIEDSKPAELSATDQIVLRYDTIPMGGSTVVKVLVNRITNKVEYVWSGVINRYIRPKFIMPGAQKLYNKTHFK
jgi:hypothetical protein